MSKDDAKKRGPRRGRGSITKNRAGNWQVRYTDPDGKRGAGPERMLGCGLAVQAPMKNGATRGTAAGARGRFFSAQLR